MAAANAGDGAALDALLRRHADRIAAVCRRVVGNDADAQDATQEALIAIVRGLPRFDGRAAFSTWAFRVATNACLDELRRRRRRPEPVDDDTLDVIGHVPSAGAIERIGDRADIDAALATLPVEFRAAVVLRDLLGFDYAEIGQILEVPPGTVRSRIARGRAGLAAVLGNPSPDADRPTPRT
ncbi:MAG: eukaryotic-like serine/threonine-protein kinase [Actinomycetota bacterium]|nr:eukaryotic-like serine/threonine-protein kinase [Actinomycetota bacterium]